MSGEYDPRKFALAGIALGILGTAIAAPLAFNSIEFILLGMPFGIAAIISASSALSRSRDIGQHWTLARTSVAIALLPFATAAVATLIWGLTR